VKESRDEFLGEEDLDLRNLSWEELIAYWNLWLEQAQATNHLDAALYSHGVFEQDPAPRAESFLPGPEPDWLKNPASVSRRQI
jgi:hypothetical protein